MTRFESEVCEHGPSGRCYPSRCYPNTAAPHDVVLPLTREYFSQATLLPLTIHQRGGGRVGALLVFRVETSGLRFEVLGFRLPGAGCRVQDEGCRV